MEDSGIDSDPKVGNGDDLLFPGNVSDSSSSSNNNNITLQEAPKSNVRQLHRKLEQRIQEAKKLQKLSQQEHKKLNSGPNLIPIQRLSIPCKGMTVSKEEVPLVDWDTEDSDDEDIHFFPLSKAKSNVKQELTDTFSIEEFEVSPDEDDLNLNPPKAVGYRRYSLCCYPFKAKCSIL